MTTPCRNTHVAAPAHPARCDTRIRQCYASPSRIQEQAHSGTLSRFVAVPAESSTSLVRKSELQPYFYGIPVSLTSLAYKNEPEVHFYYISTFHLSCIPPPLRSRNVSKSLLQHFHHLHTPPLPPFLCCHGLCHCQYQKRHCSLQYYHCHQLVNWFLHLCQDRLHLDHRLHF